MIVDRWLVVQIVHGHVNDQMVDEVQIVAFQIQYVPVILVVIRMISWSEVIRFLLVTYDLVLLELDL